MNNQDLDTLYKEFYEKNEEMSKEFLELFKKWMNVDKKLAIITAVQLPVNLILNLMNTSGNGMSHSFPELPHMMKRFLEPFFTLRKEWGKISDEKFAQEYIRIYELQFNEFLPPDK
jgi:hypothetical protein